MSRYESSSEPPRVPSDGPRDSPGPRWLSSQQAADYVGINVRTLRLHVAKGHLRCRRVGKLYKFEKEVLEEFAKVIDNR
jgi:excisionase family DNA binding protein